MMSLWNMIERPDRHLDEMLSFDNMPHVDVYVPTYSEPVEVVEPTVIAALNMNYPGSKLTLYVLDDGAHPAMASMVRRLNFQAKYIGRDASVMYLARKKVKGVSHHAKAGNINSAMLKESPGKGTFLLVLDCDMIVHPDFLRNILGHFYRKDTPDGPWVLKQKAGFIQTPQDFWNVDAKDPLVHCAPFFYGPMLQGRDGIGACPCCGTGVIFRRDLLVSLGGQSYGSITEDYNTAMNMLGAGFATMFLNKRLVFGMAPEDLQSALTQRLRWAMGALQILILTNPLAEAGLSTTQSLLFFEALAMHYLAISTTLLAIVPIPFLFTGYSPVVAPAMWVWISPNHMKAIWQVLVAESWLFNRLFKMEITFAVTNKDKGQGSQRWKALKSALGVTWPYLLWIAGYVAGIIFFIVNAAMGKYDGWDLTIYLIAIMWGMLVFLCIWPPLTALVPREETEEGWEIRWDAVLPLPNKEKRDRTRFKLQQRKCRQGQQRQMTLSRYLSGSHQLPSIDSGTSGDQTTTSEFVPPLPFSKSNADVVPYYGGDPDATPASADQTGPLPTFGGAAPASRLFNRSAGAGPSPWGASALPAQSAMLFTGIDTIDYALATQTIMEDPEAEPKATMASGDVEMAMQQAGSPMHPHASTAAGRARRNSAVLNHARSAVEAGLVRRPSILYSNAARSACAFGPSAFGRIALPGRTVAVAEAASLYTSLILPEPDTFASGGNSVIGNSKEFPGSGIDNTNNSRSRNGTRFLAIALNGGLVPSAVLNSMAGSVTGTSPNRLNEGWQYGQYEGGWGETAKDAAADGTGLNGTAATDGTIAHGTGAANGVAGACNGSNSRGSGKGLGKNEVWVQNADGAEPDSSKPAAAKAAQQTDDEARLAAIVAAACAALAGKDIDTRTMDDVELMPDPTGGRLQEVATAVQGLQQGPPGLQGPGSKVRRDSNMSIGPHYGGFVGLASNGHGFGHTMTMGTTMSVLPTFFDDAGDSTIMNTCAVIPTMPNNVYEHTIAAVPNFQERQKPQRNWMLTFLLLALIGASFVEVYVPQRP